jgi:hypothetical protein
MKQIEHRVTLSEQAARYIYAAAGLSDQCPRDWIGEQGCAIAAQIVAQGRPLPTASIPPKSRENRGRAFTIAPEVLAEIRQAIAIERKAQSRFFLRQFVEKYLLPIAYEAVIKAGREAALEMEGEPERKKVA